nr:hypothetical protein [Tanacetum cinerariifolium]
MSFKTYSNPLFDLDEEIISSEFNPIHNEDLDSTSKNDRFVAKFYLLESLLNRDESILPGIDSDDSDSEGDTLSLEGLLHNDPIPLPDNLDFLNVLSSILGNLKTLAKGFYPLSFHFLSFNWESKEQAANARYWKIPACCDVDDDDDSAITPILSTEETDNSLSMGNEHLDIIPATESDEVIKSSVEDLVPIASEFEEVRKDASHAAFVWLVIDIRPEGGDHFVSSFVLMLKILCFNFSFPYVFYVYEFGFAPSALLVALPFLLLLVFSIDGLVLIPIDTSWLRNSSFILSSPVNTYASRFKIFGRCVIRNLWNGTVASIISSSYLFSCSVSEAASPANSASQFMAWLDALNFNQMAYEYIFSLGLIRMIPTPEPSSIVSLPKYNLQAFVVRVEFA